MAVLDLTYEGKSYLLDLEDMDTDEARAMERFGVPSLKALTEGVAEGNVDSLTVIYWLMLRQNGEPGARLERVKFKPIKFLQAFGAAKPVKADGAEDPKAGGLRLNRSGSSRQA